MAGHPGTTTKSGSSEEDQTTKCLLTVGGGSTTACETVMWEEWTQATSAGEVSTSNFLADLPSSPASRLSFQQSDMLATLMSSFHPLVQSSSNPDFESASVADIAASLLHEPGLDPSDLVVEVAAGAPAMFPLAFEKSISHRQLRGAAVLRPLSPSSPLANKNGLLTSLDDPTDSCPQWSTVTNTGQAYDSYGNSARTYCSLSFIRNHLSASIDHLESSNTKVSAFSRPRHTDIFIDPNGTFKSSPGGWTPQLMYDATSETAMVGSSVTPMKLIASLREAAEATYSELCAESQEWEIGLLRDSTEPVLSVEPPSERCRPVTMSSIPASCMRSGAESSMAATRTRATQVVWPGKHRLELVEVVDGEVEMRCSSPPLLKRPKIVSASALQWNDQTLRGAELRSYYCPRSSSLGEAEAMDGMAIGMALNTNGRPRARRGSATDPQSVYARHRREKINERLKTLQNLVPNGVKVDIVTMLDEAIHYVKFLQNQVELLKSNDYWMYATPNNYNGMELSILCPQLREFESSAS